MTDDNREHPWNTTGPMEMEFMDSAGNRWTVIDFHKPNIDGPKKRVPISNWRAEGRAFVPVDRDGPVMIHEFGLVAYRWADDRTLNDQLAFARPSTATPGERLNGGPNGLV